MEDKVMMEDQNILDELKRRMAQSQAEAHQEDHSQDSIEKRFFCEYDTPNKTNRPDAEYSQQMHKGLDRADARAQALLAVP